MRFSQKKEARNNKQGHSPKVLSGTVRGSRCCRSVVVVSSARTRSQRFVSDQQHCCKLSALIMTNVAVQAGLATMKPSPSALAKVRSVWRDRGRAAAAQVGDPLARTCVSFFFFFFFLPWTAYENKSLTKGTNLKFTKYIRLRKFPGLQYGLTGKVKTLARR